MSENPPSLCPTATTNNNRHTLDAATSKATLWTPRWMQASAWIQHVPFAFWVIGATKPRIVVELGTHYGVSYMAFCQAVEGHGLRTQCFAVDTWEGDPQAGLYGEEVFLEVSAHNADNYSKFSTLIRSTFDEALDRFADGSIDLLHIDGYHTYDAVKHDFEKWLPKLSSRSVVLFHDTAVRDRNFGVYKLWGEVKEGRPHFEFVHCNGLGVLGTGPEVPEGVRYLFDASGRPDAVDEICRIYFNLGRSIQLGYLNSRAVLRWDADEFESRVKNLAARVPDLEAELKKSTVAQEKALSDMRRLESELWKSTVAQEKALSDIRHLESELRKSTTAHQEVCNDLKLKTADFETFAIRYSVAQDELLQSLREKHALETELAAIRNSLGGRLASWTRYLGRLCTQRKEASFLLLRASVFLGLSHKKREMRRHAREISRMGLVDLPWYQKRYEQLAGAFLNPIIHYLYSGAKQGCDPNPCFHSKWYLKQYRSSIPKGLNPLVHYIRKGARKNFNPNASFDTKAYLARHPGIKCTDVNPLSHYLKNRAAIEKSTGSLASDTDIHREIPPANGSGKRRVVYVSANTDTPGHIYRVEMYANALATRGYDVHVISVKDVPHSRHLLETASVIVLWRTAWCARVEQIYSIAGRNGAKVIFDLDDMIIEPELANAGVIDAIRFRKLDESKVAEQYARMRKSAAAADYCTAPTQPLLSAMRLLDKPGFLLPNGFDEETYLRTRRAVAKRRAKPNDGLVRIGYAGGTRTHQKDFACAAPAIARILREYAECRLVLFRLEQSGIPSQDDLCLDPLEYPELAGLEAQIEWLPFTPLRELPNAIALFDINLAPLEHGNKFCEAKSELKYFEAALADIPTVASPTVPFATAIKHGETGFLANNPEEWFTILEHLVRNPQNRIQIGKAAFNHVYWHYGPERRRELVCNAIDQTLCGVPRMADAFQMELFRRPLTSVAAPEASEYDVLFESGMRAESNVAVVISLFNYGHYIEEALESVKAQTLSERDIIVVDDCSTDDSVSIASAWLQRNASSFPHAALLKNKINSGLAATRNAGISFSDAPYIMVLDADNLLSPTCLERLLAEIIRSGAAAAYPLIRKFGDAEGIMGNSDWNPARLAVSNYIDAMALIRRSVWARVGGYQKVAAVGGWQDYSFWCKLVEHGLWGCWVREILAQHRVHGKSMLHTSTNRSEVKKGLVQQMRLKYPWVDLPMFERGVPSTQHPQIKSV